MGSWKITHVDFTVGRPNSRVGSAAITHNPVGSAFHITEKIPLPHILLTIDGRTFNYRFPSLGGLAIGQPTVEVSHCRFYRYGSESGISDKSICSSVWVVTHILSYSHVQMPTCAWVVTHPSTTQSIRIFL